MCFLFSHRFPQFQSLSSLFSLEHTETRPSALAMPSTTRKQQCTTEHPECPSASLSEWPDSLPVYCPLTPCPFLPLPSKCHHCPGFHHGSLHLYATSIQGSHPLPSTALSKPGSPAPTLPRLASPLLCKASSKREGNAEVKCCRKVDKGNNWDKVAGSGI